MQFNGPILCLCNYGQVRSVTMAKILQDKGYQTLAAGMINNPPNLLDKVMEAAGTVIVCNKPNVERRFRKDLPEDRAELVLSVLDKHKEKILTCDTVGFDRWGQPMHPELVERCNLFLESLDDDSLDKEALLAEIRNRYHPGE